MVFWIGNRLHPDPQRRREFQFAPLKVANAMTHRPLPKLAETILTNTRYNVIVLGHSHHPDYFSFGPAGEYFNTGTWTEVIHLDLPMLGPRRQLTYVLVELEGGERRTNLLEWKGTQRNLRGDRLTIPERPSSMADDRKPNEIDVRTHWETSYGG